MDGDSKQDHRDPKGESKEEDAKAINALAALSISLLLLAFFIARSPLGSPVRVVALFGRAAVLGALVLIGAVESSLRPHFVRFYELRYVCLTVVALAA